MVSMIFVFWIFVILAALIGMLRGWAKELLVIVSVILSIFVINVLETFVTFLSSFYEQGGPTSVFGTRAAIILLLAFFGYETPRLKFLSKGAVRERLQDSILGFVLGAINGYLIIGSLWFYLNASGYPFDFIFAPTDPRVQAMIGEDTLQSTIWFIDRMAPALLSEPLLYFLVAGLFTLVVIVFV
ncbi:MAG: CvpA family protein [Chloroflexi bacterium]|nr:CvpA family protein [Chloroflexota bacterium]